MFCFRLSFFPRGRRAGATGPSGWLRAGRASGRAGGFGPGGWLRAGQPDRATGPDRWLRAGRANHLFNWRLGPVSQPVVQPVLQPVLQPVVQSSLQPKQSLLLQQHSNRRKVRYSNRWFNRPYSRRKVWSFNQSFNSPPTDAKSGLPTGPSTAPSTDAKSGLPTDGSIVPTADAKFGPSTAPSTDAPDSHANAPQPKSQTMQRDSGRTASAILKIYVKLHIFIRKAKLSTT